jgi:transcription initiation factor TFIIIB Brf1 subunit/transcription initiation factor TFIIB
METSTTLENNFDKLNELWNDNTGSNESILVDKSCNHRNIVIQGCNRVCEECGIILTKDFSYEKEWRYYGIADTKHNNDPNRCNFRKIIDKTIDKDLEKFGINAKVVTSSNEIYDLVTKKKIFRGNTRKGIIFACVYHAYIANNIPISCEQLITILEINQKIALKGLKFVNLNLPLNSDIRKNEIDIKHLISEIMKQFNANNVQIKEIIDLYCVIENKSSLLNRSRPQSVASGIVRYYIFKNNPDFSLEYFKQKVKLSDLTLSRIVKEIETIIQKNDLKNNNNNI